MSGLGVALDKRFRRIAGLMDVGVLLLSGDGELDFASSRAETLLGIKAEQIEDWSDLLDQLREAARRSWAERADGTVVELSWNGRDRARQVAFQIHFLDEDECAGFLVVLRDLSLQRAMEADLALAAQQRNLSRLYLGLAHDLRSPLNSIVLNLELLKSSLASEAIDAEVAADRCRWLTVLEEELRRLNVSLDSLLAQTTVPSQERARFDLGKLVRELAALLTGQARQQGVEVRVEVPETGPFVEARREQVLRAALNLAVNGLESATESGRVTMTVRRDGPHAVLSISDTGPGVEPDVAERLFELHFTTKATGAGLGLYVARAAFEADGGSVELVDSPVGATFEARLPVSGELPSRCR